MSCGELEVTIWVNSYNTLFCRINQGRNLIACDANGLSDPYVVVQLLPKDIHTDDIKRKTKVQYETLNPVFQEEFSWSTVVVGLETKHLSLFVWDKDLTADEYMGQCIIHLNTLDFKDGEKITQWYPLAQTHFDFKKRRGMKGMLKNLNVKYKKATRNLRKGIQREKAWLDPLKRSLKKQQKADLSATPKSPKSHSSESFEDFTSKHDPIGNVVVVVREGRNFAESNKTIHVQVSIEGCTPVKTKVSESSLNPHWNERIQLDVTDVNADIVVAVMDEKRLIGQVILPLPALHLKAVDTGWYELFPLPAPRTKFTSGVMEMEDSAMDLPVVTLGNICLDVKFTAYESLLACYLKRPAYVPLREEEEAFDPVVFKHILIRFERLFSHKSERMLFIDDMRAGKHPFASWMALLFVFYWAIYAPLWQYPMLGAYVLVYTSVVQKMGLRRRDNQHIFMWNHEIELDPNDPRTTLGILGKMVGYFFAMQKVLGQVVRAFEKILNSLSWADDVITQAILLAILAVCALVSLIMYISQSIGLRLSHVIFVAYLVLFRPPLPQLQQVLPRSLSDKLLGSSSNGERLDEPSPEPERAERARAPDSVTSEERGRSSSTVWSTVQEEVTDGMRCHLDFVSAYLEVICLRMIYWISNFYAHIPDSLDLDHRYIASNQKLRKDKKGGKAIEPEVPDIVKCGLYLKTNGIEKKLVAALTKASLIEENEKVELLYYHQDVYVSIFLSETHLAVLDSLKRVCLYKAFRELHYVEFQQQGRAGKNLMVASKVLGKIHTEKFKVTQGTAVSFMVSKAKEAIAKGSTGRLSLYDFNLNDTARKRLQIIMDIRTQIHRYHGCTILKDGSLYLKESKKRTMFSRVEMFFVLTPRALLGFELKPDSLVYSKLIRLAGHRFVTHHNPLKFSLDTTVASVADADAGLSFKASDQASVKAWEGAITKAQVDLAPPQDMFGGHPAVEISAWVTGTTLHVVVVQAGNLPRTKTDFFVKVKYRGTVFKSSASAVKSTQNPVWELTTVFEEKSDTQPDDLELPGSSQADNHSEIEVSVKEAKGEGMYVGHVLIDPTQLPINDTAYKKATWYELVEYGDFTKRPSVCTMQQCTKMKHDLNKRISRASNKEAGATRNSLMDQLRVGKSLTLPTDSNTDRKALSLSIPGRGFGQLHYSLTCTDKLYVTVKQVTGLPMTTSGYYVKLRFFPDKANQGKHKTKIIKKSENPIFEKVFTFPREVCGSSVKLVVMMCVGTSTKKKVHGHVVLSMDPSQIFVGQVGSSSVGVEDIVAGPWISNSIISPRLRSKSNAPQSPKKTQQPQ